jgi:hypothetical protein
MFSKLAVASLAVASVAVGFGARALSEKSQRSQEEQKKVLLENQKHAAEDLTNWRNSHTASADPEGIISFFAEDN